MAACRRDRPLTYHAVITGRLQPVLRERRWEILCTCIYTYENVCRFGGSLAYTSATASHISFAALQSVVLLLTAADSC